jgi:hypothetical protein
MAIVRLQTGSSAVWAFRSMMGKIKASTLPDQPNDVEYRLVSGDRTYLPLPVSDQLRAARIQDGQQFEITRLSAHNFQIRPIGAGSVAETTPPAIAQTTTSAAQSTTSRNGNGNPPPPPAAPPTAPAQPPAPESNPASLKLMSCLKAAIDAAVEAEAYAVRRGLELRFSSEDIRTMANTIAMNGGAR